MDSILSLEMNITVPKPKPIFQFIPCFGLDIKVLVIPRDKKQAVNAYLDYEVQKAGSKCLFRLFSFLMEVVVVTFLGIRFLLERIYVLRTLPNALFALDTLHS